ncbi:MAG TPA: phosphodiester glycosidase family protein [Candidatus Nitrosotenuis sp.]|nr:phosphodiester glycosidase family protein [Candidatus Nitrosotenuis sp.]
MTPLQISSSPAPADQAGQRRERAGLSNPVARPPSRQALVRGRTLAVAALALALLAVRPLETADAAPSGWQRVAPGVELRQGKPPGFDWTLYACRLDLRRVKLRLILASQGRSFYLPQVMSGALAAVNASYFDERNRPLGYLRQGSQVVVAEVASGAAFGGVFFLDGAGRARVVHRSRFIPGAWSLALQAGPRLLDDGVPVQGLKDRSRARRTGVAVDRLGRVLLYATAPDGMPTLAEMQAIAAAPAHRGGLGAWEALNLDGGSSTQMSVRAPGLRLDVPGLSPVPVALGAFPR